MIKIKTTVLLGHWLRGGMGEILEMFSVLIRIMHPWAQTKYVKIHPKVHLRFVHFTVCKLYWKRIASEDFRE